MRKNIQWQCRIAPSLGDGFDGTPNEVWGTDNYIDNKRPTVFFGLYGFPDFYALWRHKGIKEILWAGSDITNLKNGYWMDDEGMIRINPEALAVWIRRNCGCWVENKVEQMALEGLTIPSRITPSFLGNIKDYKISYKHSNKPKLYTSVSGDDFVLYGWYKIEELAQNNPNIEFHLYGNTPKWENKKSNIIVHGRVSNEQMNKEIKNMQGALRLTEFDGFSEILAKSILWGQWPVSLIKYPYMLNLDEIKLLPSKREPNYKGREYYLGIINQYPWSK